MFLGKVNSHIWQGQWLISEV